MATILIVGDRPSNRELLVALLGYKQHHLLEVTDGAQALTRARTAQPDLIISDILMPTMDGYEFVCQLRADPAMAHIPVIFSTAHYLEREARALAQRCGVSFVLTKPCEPQEVLRAVHLALSQASLPVAPLAPVACEREPLRLLSAQLAENVHELRVANARQAALIELGLQLGAEREPQRLLETFCHTARSIIGARYAVVGVLDKDQDTLQSFCTSGMDAETAGRLHAPWLRQGVLDALLDDLQPYRQRALSGALQAVGLPPYHPPVSSALAVPIASPTHVYGCLYLTNKVGIDEFTQEDERLASLLAAQVGRLYENGRLYTELQRHTLEIEQEVAARRQAEAVQQEREQQLQALFESVIDAIIIADDAGTWREVNRSACALLGLPGEQLLGHRLGDFAAPDTDLERAWRTCLEQGRLHTTFGLCRPDGSVRQVECQAMANFLPGRHLILLYDITERRHLEAQLLQAQKMEAIGRLAGGIAHDFNNMLTVIMGYSELLLADLLPRHPSREVVEEMKRAAERSAALTGKLLAFSRKQILQPLVLNLNAVVSEMDRMLRRLIGEDIILTIYMDPALRRVKVDPVQMEQVIMNLVVNARAAMPDGGQLVMETANVELDDTYARLHPEARPGAYVMLAVSDTGHGMDEETRARLFEPFFTTKEPGEGTGLGLASVYGIMRQSNGHIAVYSEPGQGTTFKLYLPCTDEVPPATAPPPHLESPRGTETVLLVEDDRAVRQLARQVLQTCGYTVFEAHQGNEALTLSSLYQGPIHLLLTDVVMPGLSGPQLAERLVQARPGLKVLYTSGYTEPIAIRQELLQSGPAFLQKPFTPEGLARKVREVLGG